MARKAGSQGGAGVMGVGGKGAPFWTQKAIKQTATCKGFRQQGAVLKCRFRRAPPAARGGDAGTPSGGVRVAAKGGSSRQGGTWTALKGNLIYTDTLPG